MGISALWNPYPHSGQGASLDFLRMVLGANTKCPDIKFNKPYYTLPASQTTKTLIARCPLERRKYWDWWYNCVEFSYGARQFSRVDALKSLDFKESKKDIEDLEAKRPLREGAKLGPWAIGYCNLDDNPSDNASHALIIVQERGPEFNTVIWEPQRETNNTWLARDLLAKGTKFLKLRL